MFGLKTTCLMLYIAFATTAPAQQRIRFGDYVETLRTMALAEHQGLDDKQFEKMAVALYEYLEGPPTGEQLSVAIPHMAGVFIDLYVPPPDQIIVYVKRGVIDTSKEYGFSFDRKTGVLRSFHVNRAPK